MSDHTDSNTETKAAEIARDDAPPVTDLIEYLEASSARLLALDSSSGEGRAMRDGALRIKALLSMLSNEQDAAIEARNDFASLAHERMQTLEAICDVMRRRGIATGAADTIPEALSALEEGLADTDAAIGRYYEALRDIETLPEQGGCDDGPDAVDLWMLMRMRARRALENLP